MLDLKRYGIADEFPKLARLEAEVADLERRRAEAEAAVFVARNAISGAREKDEQAAAQALRGGKAMPEAKHEAKAQAALEDAERTLTAYQKAVEGATSELAAFTAEHRTEIARAIVAALRDKAARLRELTAEAAPLYATIEDSKYDLKNLTPPPPVDHDAPARDSFTVIGPVTSQAGAPQRGTVEEVLAHLASLEAQFSEPPPVQAPPTGPAQVSAARRGAA